MRLGDLVRQLGFGADTKGELFAFQSDLFKVYKVKRKEDITNGDVFSEYIFVEVSDHAIKKMTSDTEIKYFRDFQAKLLSEIFFGHKSDLRWNLYLILIVGSYDRLNDTGILQLIENDADYARKFVMTAEDALQWLDKAWLKSLSDEENVNLDPIQEWHNELVDVGLTGCLTETFLQGHVLNFLDGQAFLSSDHVAAPHRTRQTENFDEVIQQIETVTLNGFRAHCFDNLEPLHPTRVNLLHGPNGSGKTSIMEAIELAFTNEINRCSEFGDDIADSLKSIHVSCITESSNTIHFQPGKPNAFYKKLAQKWYGIPAGRQSSELNSFYHRYNFFDSEAAYRFALNESGQSDKNKFDYSDNLSRLVFGDDVIETQKKWLRYLQEFDERTEDLTKQHNNYMLMIEASKQELSKSNENGDVRFDELDRHLNAVNLRPARKQRDKNESMSAYLSRLYLLFHSIEGQRQQIVEARLDGDMLSFEYMNKQQIHLREKRNEFLHEKRNIEEFIAKRETERAELNKKLDESESLLASSTLSYDQIKGIQEKWQEIKKIVEQPDRILLRQNIEQREEELSQKVETIDHLNAKYPIINTITEKDLLLLSIEEHSALLIMNREKEAARSVLKEQLNKTEKLAGIVEATVTRLQTTGEEFLKSHESSTVCPLCAQDYGTHQALIDALAQARSMTSFNSEQLVGLHEQIRSLENEIEEIEEHILLHEKNAHNLELIDKAYSELLSSNFFKNIHLDLPINEKLNEWRTVIASRSELINELSQVRGQIRAFDDSGITRQMIIQAEQFRQENALYQEYESTDKRDSFEDFLFKKEALLLAELSRLRETNVSLEKQRDSLSESVHRQSLEAVISSITDIEQKLKHITNLLESLNLLLDDFDLGSEVNLLSWSAHLQKVQIYTELLINNQERLKEEAILQADVDEKAKMLLTIESQLKRCKEASAALGKLKPLRDYTEGFIKSNISQIERFFNMLHTPREFDRMELAKDGLLLRRKWDGKHVKGHQMSSGQRASLALSVMFAIHLAAPGAPRVLMMDEPVANMDDLHLMNLLDLLRDLSLSGRQIFFTTANPDVANLFRRKFSFYREQFTHFEFMRSSGEPVRIEPIHYSPYIEPPVIKQVNQR
ncbi:hypothetical protein [Paenibacillus harenae]|uniref:Nuclease SbcCD subunit C n=1 Tax=Paenibacillus harenae TaxID=306543 RepID=A0ABT9U3H6_PAEHA|nr:hypothetical protein [Paenibacillus harenae]MDQ0114193.1 exonuclease SbcC [Paenibacillus harenae]